MFILSSGTTLGVESSSFVVEFHAEFDLRRLVDEMHVYWVYSVLCFVQDRHGIWSFWPGAEVLSDILLGA